MKNTMKKTIAFGLTVAMLATSGILSFAEQVDEVVMLTEATETIEIQEEQVTPVPEVAEKPVIPDAEEQVPATEEPAAPEAEAPVTPEETPAAPEETPVVTEPEQVTEPEPIPQPEPVAEPEKVTETEPAAELEKVIEAEPIIEPEKVVETEPVIEPENVTEPEQTAESEKVAEAEQVTEPEQVAEPEQTVEPEAEKDEQTEETEQPADPTENMNKCCLILRAGEEFANLYTDPDLDSPVICQIPANEYVYMMGYDLQWSNVYYKDHMGYIENEKLAIYNPQPKTVIAEETPAEDIINEETPSEEAVNDEVNEADPEIAVVIEEKQEVDTEAIDAEENKEATENEENMITIVAEEEQTTVGNEETENSETEEETEETREDTENIENYEFRKMHLKSNIDGQKNFYVGQVVNMYAELEGFEGLDYTIQWQCSKDRVNMEDIPGATGPVYSFIIDETTFYYIWTYRVVLNNAE